MIKVTLVIIKITNIQVFSTDRRMEQILIISEGPDLVMSHFKMTHTFKAHDRSNVQITTTIHNSTEIIEKDFKITPIFKKDIKVINKYTDKHQIMKVNK